MTNHKNQNNTNNILNEQEENATTFQNNSWGDTLIYKKENTCRIYFQNIRNLTVDDEWIAWTDIISKMKDNNVDIFGFVEPNINWNKKMQTEATNIGKRVNKQFIMQTTTSEEYSSSTHKRGGTILCTTNKMVGRYVSRSKDPRGLGRWTTISMAGRNQRLIHVVCLYRVSQEQSHGNRTSYMQQVRLLKQQNVRNPNPRQQVLEDLDIRLQQWQGDKHDIILMMDANSDLNDGALTKILHKHKLSDAMGRQHGCNQPATYERGTRTIDYIFCTERIIDSIEKGGIIPFNELIQSDHRALFIDININKAFKGSIHETENPTTNYFTTKHKKRCKEYREQVTSEIHHHRMVERLDDIVNRYKEGKFEIDEYQKWDRNMTMIMTETAKKFKTNNRVWWSPDLHHAYLGVKYWKLKITEKQMNMDMTKQIRKIVNELPMDFDIKYGNKNKTRMGNLRAAKKYLRECKEDNKKLRLKYQKMRIIETMEKNDIKMSRRIKAIMYAEETSRMYAIIKYYLHPQDKQSLTYVDIYNKQNDKKRVVIREEVESILRNEHKNHFRQAETTPCCQKDVKNDILKVIRKDNHKFKLQHRVDHTTRAMLNKLTRKEVDPTEICQEISTRDIVKGFSKWKESTSTSPSNRTLTLYKVWIKADGNEKQLSETQFFDMLQKVIWLAIETGTPPNRWLTVHNMYIPKDQGSYKVGRLRPLHKLEADLNLVRREMSARRLMTNVERQQYLSDENYGGRNNRSSIDVVMKKVFTLTTYKLTRTNAAITDCDAKACYDRILPHVMALANIKAGLPKKTATLFMNTLHKMKYHISTGLGISKIANINDDDCPIYGIGQGATDAPAQWTLMSDIIQKIHNDKAIGTTIMNPTKTIKEARSLDMFVDDASMLHTSANKKATKNELRNIISYDITS